MSLQSLATSSEIESTTAQLAAVYSYLSSSVEPQLVNAGNAVPAVEKQGLPWIRAFENGSLDAVYTFHNSNWYTRMPTQLGTISIFDSTKPLGIGWELATATGLTLSAGYETRKFSGTGLLVVGQWAYRRFDQSLTA